MTFFNFFNSYFIVAVLLLISIFGSKLSGKLGVPSLLIFLCIGMLAGSDGIGNIYFDDALLANSLGTTALAFILFSGAFDTRLHAIKGIILSGIILSTAGVALTAAFIALFSCYVLNLPLVDSILLGTIISSTDAAAVFSVLRSRGVGLKGKIAPLLEFESGSNDPMAIFLTITAIQFFLPGEGNSWSYLLARLFVQMTVGAAAGIGVGRLSGFVFNRIKLDYEGLYPVLSISIVLLTYGTAEMFAGNGFVAVYACGITLGNTDFLYKRSVGRFNDGIAWLMQIGIFLMLGLLVFPSHLKPVAHTGIILAAFIMFASRPLAVFICLLGSRFKFGEKILISWAGFKGAVPVVLATYPLMYKFPGAGNIFNIVFFIVIISVLLQGKTLMPLARILKLDVKSANIPRSPLEFERTEDWGNETREVDILPNSLAADKKLSLLKLPGDVRVLLIRREREFIIPKGNTVIAANDTTTLYGHAEHLKEAVEYMNRLEDEEMQESEDEKYIY